MTFTQIELEALQDLLERHIMDLRDGDDLAKQKIANARSALKKVDEMLLEMKQHDRS